jgi:DNA repair exonuclease SbcCD ATPase subunit
MFPDDGFENKDKLDWDAKGPGDVALTEPCPTMPGENEQTSPTEITPETQEESVPDSPSGYVIITPSGRKKGVSPEIAQLLDRTSKRQAIIGAFEKGEAAKKRNKAGSFILIVLFIAATAIAGYQYKQSKNTRAQFASATAKAKQVRENLETKFKADIEKTNSRNKELDAQLKKTTTDFNAYKDEVEAERDAFDSLRKTKDKLETMITQLKEENANIIALKNKIKLRDENIDGLNLIIRRIRKDNENMDTGINSRDLEKEKLDNAIAKKDTRIESLMDKIKELRSSERTPAISTGEVASLRDKVRIMGFRMDSLKKELLTANDTLDRIQRGEGGQDEVNLLRMRLLDKSKDIAERDEQIAKLQYALKRYSSPESVIVGWAESLASGDLGRVMKHYAESNLHRKRWAGTDAEREEMTGEFKEFTASKIELEVLSVTINPQESSATAKLKLKLTAGGKTRILNASMTLVREFERWAILEEGF